MLGANIPIDLTVTNRGVALLDSTGKGNFRLRLGKADGTVADYLVALDFSAYNKAAVTPSQVVVVLNNALSTYCSAEIDNKTGAVNLRAKDANVTSIQCFGYLAGALGFGGGVAFRSMGAFRYDQLTRDDSITATPTRQKADDTNADQQGGGQGTLTRIVISGKITGIEYAINVKPQDYILLQMIEGGELVVDDDGVLYYNRPLPGADVGRRNIELFRVRPQYIDGTESAAQDMTHIVLEHVFSGTAGVADPSESALGLSNYNYTYKAGVKYIDAYGAEHSQPEEVKYPVMLWRRKDFVRSLSPTWGLRLMDNQAVADAAFAFPTVTISMGQAIYNAVILAPTNANGFNVTFGALSTLTDAQVSYDYDSNRVLFKAGVTAGTQTVTVNFNNSGGDSISKTFTVTVS
jgi:hypothetical protein